MNNKGTHYCEIGGRLTEIDSLTGQPTFLYAQRKVGKRNYHINGEIQAPCDIDGLVE